MKRKSFKKALAGISAAAMLVSAMPMTLIADAYSHTNIDFSDTLLGFLESDINSDSGQNSTSGDFSYVTGSRFNPESIDLNGFKITDYARYQINEQYETDAVSGAVYTNKITSAEYDWAAATADIIATNPDFIKGVTFDQTGSPKSGTNHNDNFGTIKTITLSMPVNKAGGQGGVTDTVYENIEFTVVRDENDIIKSFSDNITNEARHIILAGDIDLTSGVSFSNDPTKIPDSLRKQISYTGDIDINLNGFDLTTYSGIQVSGHKMRIWGGKTAPNTNSTISSANGLNNVSTTDGSRLPYASTLAAYGPTAVIELYDNVTISNLEQTDISKAAISGLGTLIMCGDDVIVEHKANGSGAGTGKAIGTDETGKTGIASFVAGDYKYKNGAALFDGTKTDADNFKTNGTTGTNVVTVSGLQQFTTMKVHNYNKYGFEVTDRTGDWSESTNYLDVDARTPNVKDYGYEPVQNTSHNGIVLDVTSAAVTAQNEGQLYFLAQQINDTDSFADDAEVVVNLENTEFDFSHAPLNWNPINASGVTLKIDGKYTANSLDKYSVIKNMKVNVASGNAGFVSDTESNGTSYIKNLGFENSSVSGKGSVGTVVGLGDSVTIQNVYVNNSAVKGTIKGGNYNGAIAGTLYNSAIDHTYSAADVQPVAIISGSTVTYLAKDGVKTVAGMTNFYDSGLVTPAAGSSSATYINAETSKHFKDGTVAFKLNGHNPAQTTTGDPVTFATGDSYNGTCSVDTYAGQGVEPYTKTYDQDTFGQDLSATGKNNSYPTFIDITGKFASTHIKASNRVFREIEITCTNVRTKWTATNANFLNEEVDSTKGGHTDVLGDDICDTCGAYKISEKNFDKSLIPFLSQETNDKYGIAVDNNGAPRPGDGWLNPTEIQNINKVVIDLTTEDTRDLNVSDIVDAINAKDADGAAAPTLKGISTLNQKKDSSGNLVAVTHGDAAFVDEYVFYVNDKVLCRLVDSSSNAEKKEGFLVATNAAQNGAGSYAAVTSWNEFEDVTATASNMVAVPNETTDTKYDYYVFADTNSGGKKSLPTAQFIYTIAPAVASPSPIAAKTVTFQIAFKGGIKHNDAQDYNNDGTLNIYNAGTNTTGTVKITAPSSNTYKHTYVGASCGCVIKTEECRHVPDVINPKTHTVKCDICQKDYGTEAHKYEVMFTIGNVTVQRCIGCGYVTAVKDTNITVSTPVLDKVDKLDASTGVTNKLWRQTYDFNITVGDGELISYGVIYKKNPTATVGINSSKVAAPDEIDATGPSPASGSDDIIDDGFYFEGNVNTGITIDAAELTKDGVNYTSRKGIKTSGTYRVNVDMPNNDEAVQIVGYVIYKAADGDYKVKVTDVAKNTFLELAQAEMEACNFVEEAGKTVDTTGLKPRFLFNYDIGENYTIKNYGLILTRNSSNPVTDKTVIADAVPYSKALVTSKICKTERTVSASVKTLVYGADVSMSKNETSTIRAYAVISDKYELTWEIYSDVQQHITNS